MLKQECTIYIKVEESYLPNFSRTLRRCFSDEELKINPSFVSKIIDNEPVIRKAICLVDIKSIPHPDKMKHIKKCILNCIGESQNFYMKPNLNTIEFKILDIIVLSVCIESNKFSVKKMSLSELKESILKLTTSSSYAVCRDLSELETLRCSCNASRVSTLLFPAKNNKTRHIYLSTRYSEGLGPEGKPNEYINGSGRTESASVRYELFELENPSCVVKTSKRKRESHLPSEDICMEECDPDVPEPKTPKPRGRRLGSKNKVDVVSVAFNEAKALINAASSCNHNFVVDTTQPKEIVRRLKRKPHYESSAAALVNKSEAPPSGHLSRQDSQLVGKAIQCSDEGFISSTCSHLDDTKKSVEEMEWLHWNLHLQTESSISSEFNSGENPCIRDSNSADGVPEIDDINLNAIIFDKDTNCRQPSNSSEESIFDLSPLFSFSDDLSSF